MRLQAVDRDDLYFIAYLDSETLRATLKYSIRPLIQGRERGSHPPFERTHISPPEERRALPPPLPHMRAVELAAAGRLSAAPKTQ